MVRTGRVSLIHRWPRRLGVAAALGVALLTTVSCSLHTIYRKQTPYTVDLPAGARISVIEFDDHGEFWDRAQLDYALGQIGAAQQDHGAIVMTFMHGWNNNASRGNEYSPDGNLYKFKKVVSRIAELEKAGEAAGSGPARPVVGVYLAWRGQGLHSIFNVLSFYTRLSAAQKVGSGTAVTESLLAIAGLVRSNDLSQSVIVGHSFGGLIVEKAVFQSVVKLATQAAFSKRQADGSFRVDRVNFPADLLVLVNPAAPALYARSELSALEAWRLRAKEKVDDKFVCQGSANWRPLIVSITSVGDSATGVAFPLGASLGYSLENYRDYTYANKKTERPPIDNSPLSQRYFYTHTEGHIPEIYSHELIGMTPAPEGQNGVVAPCSDDPCSGDPNTLCYVSGTDRFTLTRTKDSLNQNTPYWIMPAPITLIKDHGDVFNDRFTEMLAGLLEVNGIVRSMKAPAKTHAH